MYYLSKEEISEIHDTILRETGGATGVLNEHALLMLETQPALSIFGKELYPDIFTKAAFYERAINGGHIFVDGNKRTGIAVAEAFLDSNNYFFEPEEKNNELENFSLDVACNRLSLEEIALWIKRYSGPKS